MQVVRGREVEEVGADERVDGCEHVGLILAANIGVCVCVCVMARVSNA